MARVQCARVAFDEALAFLQSAKPVRQLALSAGLTAASQDHVGDHFTKNLVGTTGSDGADSLSRANRYGEWSLLCGESIGYGGRLRTHTHTRCYYCCSLEAGAHSLLSISLHVWCDCWSVAQRPTRSAHSLL